MKTYRHVFFDLDHTLWDFDKNSEETLAELYDAYQLTKHGFSKEIFIQGFIEVNHSLWGQFNRKELDRDELRERRFVQVFEKISPQKPNVPKGLSEDYIANCPKRPHVHAGAHETLDYLKQKYTLSIITNGFPEIQATKLRSSQIDHYFSHIVTSRESGSVKPDKAAFEYILKKNHANATECIMVGDDLLADMGGARNAGIDHVFFNPHKKQHSDHVTFEISHLIELKKIL